MCSISFEYLKLTKKYNRITDIVLVRHNWTDNFQIMSRQLIIYKAKHSYGQDYEKNEELHNYTKAKQPANFTSRNSKQSQQNR